MRLNTSRQALAERAHQQLALQSEGSDLHGDCSRPLEQHVFGYPDPVRVMMGLEPDRALARVFTVRCRKCPECMDHRRRLWTARAISECAVSTRTWFGTLTLAPDWATWARMSALASIETRQSELNDPNLFVGMVQACSPELSKFLDRVRKTARFRYLLVTEAHQSGVPHWHMLLHENGKPISKRILDTQWKFGFSKWRLIDGLNPKEAGYVCKYLSKTLATRVRGSQGYGTPDLSAFTERILEATRVVGNAVSNRFPAPVAGHPGDGEAPEATSTIAE